MMEEISAVQKNEKCSVSDCRMKKEISMSFHGYFDKIVYRIYPL